MNKFSKLLACALACYTIGVNAQKSDVNAVKANLASLEELSEQDVSEINITNEFLSKHNGITHLYGAQAINGVSIANSSFTAAFDSEGNLLNVFHRFYSNVRSQMSASSASIDAQSAIYSAVANDISGVSVSAIGDKMVLTDGNNFQHETNAELVYYMTREEGLKLAWTFDVDMPKQNHWWHFFVDAESGEILGQIDWTVSCSGNGHNHNATCISSAMEMPEELPSSLDGSGYNVFEFPVESPNHGVRTLATEPALELASPFGWHDINGVDGAEYTITRGNNVYAYEDQSDSNTPGYSTDGGSDLNFNAGLSLGDEPENYLDASLTNLFYANNRIHDLLFVYGFDEAAGNFQTKNYTNAGGNGDEVRAEGQDGEAFNNANMSTPPDGNNPRMQMYLWNYDMNFFSLVNVNEPMDLAGMLVSSDVADFGAEVPEGGLTGDLVLASDGTGPDENDLCDDAINAADLEGKIAVVIRGNCSYTGKVTNAMDAGAIACLVINNVPGVTELVGTSSTIDIPAIMISQEDGASILDALSNDITVNITLNPSTNANLRDGSFDNGIVTHEYVHGLSGRLTGGASNTSCLWNDEQMGEGWSDWYANMLTLDINVPNPVYRPMGTYANGEAPSGNGIRPVPYDTSFVVNSYTYDDLGNNEISIPHGVGFVWATMLWDLSWAFIDEYGYQDIETGTEGGNNIVMQLVTDGLKLQPCSPGFVDGRDAILLADEINNDGANQCLIWKVFARRGLGYSADQGSSQSRVDGDAAFDIPVLCQTALVAPTAGFSATPENTCFGLVQFTDESVDIPQGWAWDFGDGNTSDEQNPTHQYENEGEYTVTLTVTNTIGDNTLVETNYINFSTPGDPSAEGASGCVGETVTLSASTGFGDIVWMDSDDNIVYTGDDFDLVLGESSAEYFASSMVESIAPVNVGPLNGNIGSGGNHGSTFVGTVDFEAHSQLTIQSAYVTSGATGVRTIKLWDEASGEGTLIQEIEVNIDFTGGDRIDLGFEIPGPGIYSIGLDEADLYRNDGGVDYPYSGGLLMDIIGSSAGPDYYYYFYDLEVSAPLCLSNPVAVMAEVTGDASFTADVTDNMVQFTSLSSDASSWSWDFGDGETSDEENPTHTYTTGDVYTVTLTTDDGCQFTMELDIVLAGIQSFEEGGITAMPNPAKDFLNIQNLSSKQNVTRAKLIDLSGRVVMMQGLVNGTDNAIKVADLASGFYLLILEDEEGTPRFQQKISVVQ